jgi:hypothetical protein
MDERENLQAPTSAALAAKARMQLALRALGERLGGAFAGLSADTRERLATACSVFASLIEAAEDAPDGGVNLRAWPRFLLSALFSLELTADALPLAEEDEAWLVAEIESDVKHAETHFRLSTGRDLAPPRPPALVSELLRS